MVISQAVIKEVALPFDLMLTRQKVLPVSDDLLYPNLAWESDDGVQMVGHQQHQAAMPDQILVVVFGGRQDGRASWLTTELVQLSRNAVDRDEEEPAVGYP